MEWSHLTHYEATFSLHSFILRKLAYPLAITTFMEEQCVEIMWLILWAGLPKVGCL